MSIQFNDTTNYKGLVQIYEKECGYNRGDVSGNSDLLKEFTADCNIALDEFNSIAIQSSGKWQFDDSNQTDYPIITTNIVSGQRDYSFTLDGSSNLILDIYKVAILPSATATLYQGIDPTDELIGDTDIVTGNTNGGTPYSYGKLSNGIFLEPRPNYNATSGLKIFINRETTYFTSSDTTKKPGVPGILHEYFALKPALKYAGRKNLANYKDLQRRIILLEGDESQRITGLIAKYYGKREKDDRPVLYNEPIIYQ
jgi:hypothetical protein